jgi:hypothetical protein
MPATIAPAVEGGEAMNRSYAIAEELSEDLPREIAAEPLVPLDVPVDADVIGAADQAAKTARPPKRAGARKRRPAEAADAIVAEIENVAVQGAGPAAGLEPPERPRAEPAAPADAGDRTPAPTEQGPQPAKRGGWWQRRSFF